MNTPRIPDEVRREIKEHKIKASPTELRFRSHCGDAGCSAAVFWSQGHSAGAQAFYPKGYTDGIREVCEWLRSDLPAPFKLYEALFWADEFERRFLKEKE